jgi:hypothetical protein
MPEDPYFFLVAGTVLSLAAVPDWKIEFALSVLGVFVINWATGRSLPASVSGLLAAVTVVLLKTDPSGLPLGYRLVGLLAALICVVPLGLRPRHQTGFPLLGAFCAIQGLYIYVGALVASQEIAYQTLYTTRIRELGLVGSLVWVSALVGAGLLARRLRPIFPALRRWTSRTTELSSETFSRSVVLFVIGLGFLRLVPTSITSQMGAIPQVIGLARIVGFALMLLLWLRGRLTPIQKAFVLLAVIVDVVSGTNSYYLLYESSGVALRAHRTFDCAVTGARV